MISDADIDKALDYLRDHAPLAAKARAERIYMEEYRKVVKAKLMGSSNLKLVSEQERFAYSHDDYADHLDAMRTAIEKDELERFLLNAASAKIDAWRTEQSNQRAMSKIV